MCSINKKYLYKGLQTRVQTGNHSLTRTLMHLRVSNVHVPGPGNKTDLQTIPSSEDRPEPRLVQLGQSFDAYFMLM